ncbi:MAG: WbqC family protein [Bacteroidales bacterium]|nr:WbqC family protein [Candidatus Colimorpha onthohippi]
MIQKCSRLVDMSVTAIFPTAYLPPISYWAALMRHEEVYIEVLETYPKQTYRNRCVIATAGGPMDLTVQVSRPQGNHTITADVTISYAERFNIRHWRAIQSAYNATPYFLYYRDELETILTTPFSNLVDFNEALLKYVLKRLKINTVITRTTQFIPPSSASLANAGIADCRQMFSPRLPKCQMPAYPQVFDEKLPFLPDVSIIDLLFNLGPEACTYMAQLKM